MVFGFGCFIIVVVIIAFYAITMFYSLVVACISV